MVHKSCPDLSLLADCSQSSSEYSAVYSTSAQHNNNNIPPNTNNTNTTTTAAADAAAVADDDDDEDDIQEVWIIINIIIIYLLKSGYPTVLHKAPRPLFGRAVERSVEVTSDPASSSHAATPSYWRSVYDYALKLKVHYSHQ